MVAIAKPRTKQKPLPRLRYDPQDYRTGPVAVLMFQVALVTAFVYSNGSLGALFLPATLGLLPLLIAGPAMILIPRTTLMQFPVSLSWLTLMALILVSYLWSVDQSASYFTLIVMVPAALTMMLAAGTLSEREVMTGLLWGIRLTVLITLIALLIDPSTRTHVSTDQYLPDYPGWHGWFNHKNQMTPILVFSTATVLVYDRQPLTRWTTLGLLGVLLAGSSSATGVTTAAFAVIVWFWLRIYSGQQDTRDRTLYVLTTLLGGLTVLATLVASIATVTSAYGKDTSFSGRTDIWEAAIVTWLKHPFLGHGYGALFWRNPVGPETLEIWRLVGFPASHAHNGPLDILLQIGLVGLVVYGVVWFTTLRKGWLALHTRRDLAVWTVTFILANLMMAFSESVFLGPMVGYLAIAKLLLMRRPAFTDLPERRILSERFRR